MIFFDHLRAGQFTGFGTGNTDRYTGFLLLDFKISIQTNFQPVFTITNVPVTTNTGFQSLFTAQGSHLDHFQHTGS
jgi:hypothetical protein